MAIRLEFVSDSKKAQADLKQLDQAVKSIDKSTEKLSKSFSFITKSLGTLVATYATFRTISSSLDSFTRLENRVALVTGRTKQLSIVLNQVRDISSRTRAPIDDIAQTFNRLAISARASVPEALALTETLVQAGKIGGGSVETISSSLIQLNQGIAAGALRGEELNSVLEGLPRVAQALADELDVDIAALRSLAEQGQITSRVIKNALKNSAEEIRKEFELIEPTISEGFQAIERAGKNLVKNLIGAFGFGGSLGRVLDNFAKTLTEFGDKLALRIIIITSKIETLIIKFQTALLKAGIGLDFSFREIFGGILASTGILSLALFRIISFTKAVASLFFGLFIYLVGRSIVPDMWKRIVKVTADSTKDALNVISGFTEDTKESFDELNKEIKNPLEELDKNFKASFEIGVLGVSSLTAIFALVAKKFSLALVTALTGTLIAGTSGLFLKFAKETTNVVREELAPLFSNIASDFVETLVKGISGITLLASVVASPQLALNAAVIGAVIFNALAKFFIGSNYLSIVGQIIGKVIKVGVIGALASLALDINPITLASDTLRLLDFAGIVTLLKIIAVAIAENPVAAGLSATSLAIGVAGGESIKELLVGLGKLIVFPGLAVGEGTTLGGRQRALNRKVAPAEARIAEIDADLETSRDRISRFTANARRNVQAQRKIIERQQGLEAERLALISNVRKNVGKEKKVLDAKIAAAKQERATLQQELSRERRLRGGAISSRRGIREEGLILRRDIKVPQAELTATNEALAKIRTTIVDGATRAGIVLGTAVGTYGGVVLGQRFVDEFELEGGRALAAILASSAVVQSVTAVIGGGIGNLVAKILIGIPAIYRAAKTALFAFLNNTFLAKLFAYGRSFLLELKLVFTNAWRRLAAILQADAVKRFIAAFKNILLLIGITTLLVKFSENLQSFGAKIREYLLQQPVIGPVLIGLEAFWDRAASWWDTIKTFIEGLDLGGKLEALTDSIKNFSPFGINIFGGGRDSKFEDSVVRLPGDSSAKNFKLYATGGLLKGPGTGTSDSIPALLSNGEYVINAKATAKNKPLLDAINYSGVVPKFATGGMVNFTNTLVQSAGKESLARVIEGRKELQEAITNNKVTESILKLDSSSIKEKYFNKELTNQEYYYWKLNQELKEADTERVQKFYERTLGVDLNKIKSDLGIEKFSYKEGGFINEISGMNNNPKLLDKFNEYFISKDKEKNSYADGGLVGFLDSLTNKGPTSYDYIANDNALYNAVDQIQEAVVYKYRNLDIAKNGDKFIKDLADFLNVKLVQSASTDTPRFYPGKNKAIVPLIKGNYNPINALATGAHEMGHAVSARAGNSFSNYYELYQEETRASQIANKLNPTKYNLWDEGLETALGTYESAMLDDHANWYKYVVEDAKRTYGGRGPSLEAAIRNVGTDLISGIKNVDLELLKEVIVTGQSSQIIGSVLAEIALRDVINSEFFSSFFTSGKTAEQIADLKENDWPVWARAALYAAGITIDFINKEAPIALLSGGIGSVIGALPKLLRLPTLIGTGIFAADGIIKPEKFASGGKVSGPGGPREDKIPAMLSAGEYVINADATKKNKLLLDAINYGNVVPKFADGGLVGFSTSLLQIAGRDSLNRVIKGRKELQKAIDSSEITEEILKLDKTTINEKYYNKELNNKQYYYWKLNQELKEADTERVQQFYEKNLGVDLDQIKSDLNIDKFSYRDGGPVGILKYIPKTAEASLEVANYTDEIAKELSGFNELKQRFESDIESLIISFNTDFGRPIRVYRKIAGNYAFSPFDLFNEQVITDTIQNLNIGDKVQLDPVLLLPDLNQAADKEELASMYAISIHELGHATQFLDLWKKNYKGDYSFGIGSLEDLTGNTVVAPGDLLLEWNSIPSIDRESYANKFAALYTKPVQENLNRKTIDNTIAGSMNSYIGVLLGELLTLMPDIYDFNQENPLPPFASNNLIKDFLNDFKESNAFKSKITEINTAFDLSDGRLDNLYLGVSPAIINEVIYKLLSSYIGNNDFFDKFYQKYDRQDPIAALEQLPESDLQKLQSIFFSIQKEVQTLIGSIPKSQIFNRVLSKAGSTIGQFAMGGKISGPGGSREDKIPAMLSNGEYVINAAATKKNKPLLDAINFGGMIPKFAQGGQVLQYFQDGGEAQPRQTVLEQLITPETVKIFDQIGALLKESIGTTFSEVITAVKSAFEEKGFVGTIGVGIEKVVTILATLLGVIEKDTTTKELASIGDLIKSGNINISTAITEEISKFNKFGLGNLISLQGVNLSDSRIPEERQTLLLQAVNQLNLELTALQQRREAGQEASTQELLSIKNRAAVIEGQLDTIRNINAGIQENTAEANKFLAELVTGGVDQTKTDVATLFKNIIRGKDFKESFDQFVNSFLDNLAEVSSKAFTEAVFKASDKFLENATKALFEWLSSGGDNTGTIVGEGIKNIFDTITGKSYEADINPLGSEVAKNYLTDPFGGATNAVTEFNPFGTSKTLSDPLDQIVKDSSTFGDVLGSIDTSGTVPDLTKGGEVTIGEEGALGGEAFLTSLESIFNNTLSRFGGIFESLPQLLQDGFSAATDLLAGLFSSFGGGSGSAGGTGGLVASVLGFAGEIFGASGGYIKGSGSGTSDSIPAMLSNGEYVINAKATKTFRPLLDSINSGASIQYRATGGYVGDSYGLNSVYKEAMQKEEAKKVENRNNVNNITFALEGDFDSRTERAIRKFVNSGVLQANLNQANVENGGNPVFKGR